MKKNIRYISFYRLFIKIIGTSLLCVFPRSVQLFQPQSTVFRFDAQQQRGKIAFLAIDKNSDSRSNIHTQSVYSRSNNAKVKQLFIPRTHPLGQSSSSACSTTRLWYNNNNNDNNDQNKNINNDKQSGVHPAMYIPPDLPLDTWLCRDEDGNILKLNETIAAAATTTDTITSTTTTTTNESNNKVQNAAAEEIQTIDKNAIHSDAAANSEEGKSDLIMGDAFLPLEFITVDTVSPLQAMALDEIISNSMPEYKQSSTSSQILDQLRSVNFPNSKNLVSVETENSNIDTREQDDDSITPETLLSQVDTTEPGFFPMTKLEPRAAGPSMMDLEDSLMSGPDTYDSFNNRINQDVAADVALSDADFDGVQDTGLQEREENTRLAGGSDGPLSLNIDPIADQGTSADTALLSSKEGQLPLFSLIKDDSLDESVSPPVNNYPMRDVSSPIEIPAPKQSNVTNIPEETFRTLRDVSKRTRPPMRNVRDVDVDEITDAIREYIQRRAAAQTRELWKRREQERKSQKILDLKDTTRAGNYVLARTKNSDPTKRPFPSNVTTIVKHKRKTNKIHDSNNPEKPLVRRDRVANEKGKKREANSEKFQTNRKVFEKPIPKVLKKMAEKGKVSEVLQTLTEKGKILELPSEVTPNFPTHQTNNKDIIQKQAAPNKPGLFSRKKTLRSLLLIALFLLMGRRVLLRLSL